MNRYHKKVYFPIEDKSKLELFNNMLNALSWKYTQHCIENIKYRVQDIPSLLNNIKDLKLQYENIFEYYTLNNNIVKVCYKIEHTAFDYVLVLGMNKQIITIYINSKGDNHDTLQENLYCRA